MMNKEKIIAKIESVLNDIGVVVATSNYHKILSLVTSEKFVLLNMKLDNSYEYCRVYSEGKIVLEKNNE